MTNNDDQAASAEPETDRRIDDSRVDGRRIDGRRIGWKLTVVICLVVVSLGVAGVMLIFSTEPTATRGGATKETAMLVDVIPVTRGSYHPEIVAMGTVTPAQDIILSPRIEGRIVQRSDSFTPGGFVDEGEVLLEIEPDDYENTLRQRESELRHAVAELEVEMGRQNVAKQGYELLDETLSAENEALVLRKPQLNTARADVEAARAAVDQAKLDVERTRIRAPFRAHILSRNVNIGSQVSPGAELGRLVGVDTYWVEATVPLGKVHRLTFADDGDASGSLVKVRNRSAWPEGAHREGRLFRLIGALEGRTRLARVLVSVDDPLVHEDPSSDLPALMLGSYVEARIRSKAIDDVVRLNRNYVHRDDTAWVMEEGALDIRHVDIVFNDAEYAYIEEGLEDGDRVVTTNLTTVVDGAKLRLQNPGAAPQTEDTGAADETEPGNSTPSGNAD